MLPTMTLALLLALAPQQDPALEQVSYPLEDGGEGTVQRGLLDLPLVRAAEDSATIQVEFHRFPCEREDTHNPPIFMLRGGPGFRGLGPQLRRKGFYEQNLRALTRIADVVVVGQRGIGSSTPDTACGSYEREDLRQPRDLAAHAARLAAGCVECRDKWTAQGLDLTGFNVIEAAGDVIAVADALGYERITLVGSSFGSHWGMAILRYHEDRVARALLSGIEGPDHTYDMPTHVLNALRRIAAAAEASPELAELVPEGGLLAAFEALITRAKQEPIRYDDRIEVLLDAHRLRDLALGVTSRASSRRGISTWPRDMLALLDGEFGQAAQYHARRNFVPRLPTASFFMLDCGSGISPARRARLLADPAAAIVGPLGGFYEATCPTWGADLGEDFRAGFETEVPTVLVHGTWDTSTPFENALELAPRFLAGKLVVVEGGSHGAMGEALSASPEFKAAITLFLESGDMETLPGLVQLPPVEWVVPD